MAAGRNVGSSVATTGQFQSTKSADALPVRYRSKLVGDLFVCTEVDPAVQALHARPARIPYRDERGAKRVHEPDAVVTFVPYAGTKLPALLLDVQYASALRGNRATVARWVVACREYAREHGMRYRLLTEREIRTPFLENARKMVPALRARPGTPPTDAHAHEIVAWLHFHGRSTVAALLSGLVASQPTTATTAVLSALWSLLARHEVRADLTRAFEPGSVVWLPGAGDDAWTTCRPPERSRPDGSPDESAGVLDDADGRAAGAIPRRAWTHSWSGTPDRLHTQPAGTTPRARDVLGQAPESPERSETPGWRDNGRSPFPPSQALRATGPGGFPPRRVGPVLYGGRAGGAGGGDSAEHVRVQELGTRRQQLARRMDLGPVIGGNAATPAPRRLAELHSLPSTAVEIAELRLDVIRPLLAPGACTEARVREAATGAGVSRATVYRWLRAYLRGGRNLAALAPDFAARGRRESRLSDAVEAFVAKAAAKFMRQAERPPVFALWEEVDTHCKRAGERTPAKSTIYERVAAIAAARDRDRAVARAEKQAAAAGPETGRAPATVAGATYPHALVQIDHTKVNVMIVDEEFRLQIGRPWLTVAIDVYSRMVLGFWLGLDPPSAGTVGLCLLHGILDKHQWLAGRDVPGEWPCYGLPDVIHADNAREFHSESLRRICATYGMDLQWRPLGKPHYGGWIERYIGTSMNKIETLPGTTFANVGDRREYDSEGRAIFTLRELEKYYATWITLDYHRAVHGELLVTPAARYEEGIVGTAECVGRPPSRPTDEGRLHLDLLPSFSATVRPGGLIVRDHVWYRNWALSPLAREREPGNPRRSRRFEFKEDPRDCHVYHWDSTVGDYLKLPFNDPAFAAVPMSVWDRRAAVRRAKELGLKTVNEAALLAARKELEEQRGAAARRTSGTRGTAARRHAERRRDHAGGVRRRDAAIDQQSGPSAVPVRGPDAEPDLRPDVQPAKPSEGQEARVVRRRVEPFAERAIAPW